MGYGDVDCESFNPTKENIEVKIYTADGYNGCSGITRIVNGEVMIEFLSNPKETPFGLSNKASLE